MLVQIIQVFVGMRLRRQETRCKRDMPKSTQAHFA